MNVAVVIPVRNGAVFIRSCLGSLLAQDSPSFAIVAVDNGSNDDAAAIIAAEFPQVQLVRSAEALGFAGAVNCGIRTALESGVSLDTVVVLNQDTEAHPGWLAALTAPLEDPSVGIVGSQARFPDGTVQHAGAEILWPLGYGRNLGYGGAAAEQASAEPEYVAAVGVALRRAMLDAIGLLDEGFNPAYFEDADLCLRARAAGWRVIYAPEAILTHHEGARTAAGDYGHAALLERNRLRLVLKHMPAQQLLSEFRAAEERQVAARLHDGSATVLRRAYLDALLMLPALAANAPWRDQAHAVAGMLIDLRTRVSRPARPQHTGQPARTTMPTRAPRPDPRPAELPPVAIVMLTWNGLDYTRACLDSLRRQTEGVDYQLVVVDNGSTDGTREYLRTLDWITLVENATNEGFTRGNNRGFLAAWPNADILMLNNDTLVLHADWLARLRATAHSDPTIGIVGCKLMAPNGRLAHAGTYMLTDALWGWQVGGDEEDIGQFPGARPVEGVIGACMYIRRDAFDAIGPLDDQFFSYYEDTDYCLRATEAGYTIVLDGDVRVVHYENVSTKLNNANFWKMYGASQAIFRSKWEGYYRRKYAHHLLWHAQVSAPSGYAVSSRKLALALDESGVDVRLAYLYGNAYAERSSGDPRIEQMRQRARDTSLPQVLYGPGDLFHKNSGSYRVGYTMLEIDGLPDEWVRQANQLDEIWAPSHFNAETFRSSGVARPIHVVPLGVDPNYFHPQIAARRMSQRFTFLSVFEWGERKAPEVLLRAFHAAFGPRDDVALVLKVDNRDPDIDVARAIAGLGLPADGPRVALLLNQDLPAYQLGSLYRSADCFVLPTRGEGWGMPILEAMACGLPVIATDWSAPTEFLREGISYPLRVRGLVPAVARNPYYSGFSWADPDFDHLVYLLRHVYEQRDQARALGARAAATVAQKWTWQHAAAKIITRLNAIG